MNPVRESVKRKLRSAVDVDEIMRKVDELIAITDRQRVRIGDLERELARVSPQVAALEMRLETLREQVADQNRPADDSVDPDDRESLRLELRRQQEQVRARVTAAARFEERLRKLEEERAHG